MQQDAGPAIEGKAAYVFDVVSGKSLYEKNSGAQLPLASLTKIMTILTALQTLPPDATVTITKDALSADGDNGLKAGEEWKVKDLADFTLIESANDGARALMLAAAKQLGITPEVYIESMNRKARSLGLDSTYFINETGLDVTATLSGAYGSARDIAKLIAYVSTTNPALMERSIEPEWHFRSLSGVTHDAHNTALLAAAFSSAVASKTGYTDLAGGNMSFVFEPVAGRPVAVVVLGSSHDGRIADAKALSVFAESQVRHEIACTDQP
jgi:D-alanyl-D-alanine carboxypeptidase